MNKICSKRSGLSLAAVQVGYNEDLLREIFLRLHASYLVKFQVVSKQWYSLISDPKIRDYYRFSTPSGLYFCNSLSKSDNKSEEIESVSLDGCPNQSSFTGVPSLSFLDVVSPGSVIKILDSCHGLLLCELTYYSFPEVVGGELCVCNPTTRKHKVIPQPSLKPREFIAAINLAFDPSESLHYKLVCVKSINFYSGCTRYLEVYSSETGSWKRASCSIRRYAIPLLENAFYWNDTIHWVSSEVGHQCLFDKFDPKTEKVKIVLLPEPSFKRAIRYFAQSPGYWHIIYIPSFSAHEFNILEMDINTFIWSVKYKVNIYPLLSVFPEIVRYTRTGLSWDGDRVYAFSILSFIKGEKDEDSELVLHIPGKVVSYNLKQKTVKVLRELPYQFVYFPSYGFINSHQFVDSLFSV